MDRDELDDELYVMNKVCSSAPASKFAKKGRGSNGMAFLYNNDISLTKPVVYYRNRIAVMELGLLVIIGVYMVFDDGKLDTLDELISDLTLIKQLVLDFNHQNKKTIITGDFNIDFSRQNNLHMLCISCFLI
jgi:exonuclease III